MTTPAILQMRLQDAEEAYHQLMTGCKEIEIVDQNGERIKYARMDLNALRSYIQDLKQQLGMTPCGPMRFIF